MTIKDSAVGERERERTMSKFWAADSDDSSSESSSDDSSSSSSSSGGGKAGGDRWVMDSDSGEFTRERPGLVGQCVEENGIHGLEGLSGNYIIY